MHHQIFTNSLGEMSPQDQAGMFRLRFETFSVRLGWEVETTPDGLEIDKFDRIPEANYILAKSPGESIDACWRLLPTLGPNMLRDVFSQLMNEGDEAPAAADVWELSRFALAARRESAEGDNPQYSFGPLSMALMAEAARFAAQHGIVRYVTVTTAAIERMLNRQGLHVHRLGPPRKIGNVLTVVCAIEVDAQTLDAVAHATAAEAKEEDATA